MKVLIYALGGGWGHLTRAAALASELQPAAQVRILSNSPYLDLVQAAMPELAIEPVSTREQAVTAVQRELDVLVVDTFPRGLGGELADLLPVMPMRKVLIHRILNPDYVARFGLRSFAATHYDLILCPGERGVLSDLPQARETAPWLTRSVPIEAKADIVVCAGGNAEELSWYGETTALLSVRTNVRCLAAELPPGCPTSLWVQHWPAVDWIARARVVAGGAGYNTVHECRALNVPLIARPWPRKYDRQHWRAQQHPGITIVETPQEAARAALEALEAPHRPGAAIENGIIEAAQIIRRLANCQVVTPPGLAIRAACHTRGFDQPNNLMSDPLIRDISAAHSPDSDDAFMFYGLATKKIRSQKVAFKHILSDIETLNQKARDGVYDLTAISYHAYPYIADKYSIMACGSSIGDSYGPMLIALHPMDVDDIKGKRIAIPGKLTTAYLTLKIMQPDFEAIVVPFDKILEAVQEGLADIGLIIHEAQLTYNKSGFHKIIDLGKWWKTSYGLPLPLGCNALLRALPADIQSECCRMMRDSIQYALDNHSEALEYAMQFARDMDPRLAEKFVGMYVNHYTVDGGEIIQRSAQKLLDLGHEVGLIPNRVTVEFVR